MFLDCKESSEVHRPAWAQQSHAQVRQRARDCGEGRSHKLQKREVRPSQRDQPGEGQSAGIIEHAGLVAGQARTLKAALEHRTGTGVPPDARILCWLAEFPACWMNRCDMGSDGKTSLHRLGERTTHRSWNSERRSCTCRPSQQEDESGNRDSILESLLACRTRRQRQWSSPSEVWRSRHAQRTSREFLSRRDGTRTEYSECELSRGLQMAVTMHSTFKSERRVLQRWFFAPVEKPK